MKNWYSIKNRSSDVIDLSIHDEIGTWGVSAYDLLTELHNHKEATAINLSINSPGGNLIDGLAIYNALVAHKAKVYANVIALAGSAASFIMMAAEHSVMPENSIFFIHKAQGIARGESDDFREIADTMDMYESMIVNIYMKKATIGEDKIKTLMKEARPIKASDAVEFGFVDQISDSIDIAAKAVGFEKYVPQIETDGHVENITNERDLEKYLRDSGISRSLATALASRAKVVFQSDSDPTDKEAISNLSETLSRIKIPESLNASTTG